MSQLSLFDSPDPGDDDDSDRRAKALAAHEVLCKEYGCPIPYFHSLDPLSELVSSMLSHRTKNRDSGRAFRKLAETYGKDEVGWRRFSEAPPSEIVPLIADVTWPEQKARNIPAALREIMRRQDGRLSLALLDGMTDAAARRWLESLPGVGPKTSAAVLSFSSLRRRALAVDSHHFRVATRLRLISESTSLVSAHERLQALLPRDWDAQRVYDHHEVMMLHGQRCCFHEQPACGRCPALSLCPYGLARTARAA